MFFRKSYLKKYKKERKFDEALMILVFKVIGSTALLFLVAIGVDIYRLLS